jgi:hypothetical protein
MVDDETGTMVDHDMEQLFQVTGQKLTVSQYLRLIIDQRVRAGVRDPHEAGWGEGFRRGLGDFKIAFEKFMYKYVDAHEAPTGDDESAPLP